MTKRAEAKYKIDRRMGENIWGRPSSPFNKREYGPGQHGQRRKGKATDFGTQLKAKQKVKGYYGNISERQFHKYYVEARRLKGDSSANLIGQLERRLDALIYRAKFVPTVFAARQFVNHGHIKVNGRRVNIASYQVKVGDLVEIKESSRQMPLVLEANALAERDVPDYIEVDHAKGTAKLTRVPGPLRSALSDAHGAEPGHRVLFALTVARGSRQAGPARSRASSGPSGLQAAFLAPRLRGGDARGGRITAKPPGSHADPSLRNRGPRRRPLSCRRRSVRAQRRARQMAGRGLRRRPIDDAALDRRGRRAGADDPVAARQAHRSAPGAGFRSCAFSSPRSTRSPSTTRRAIMPLADVMTFYMATPLIVTALSAPLLGEKVERFRWIAVLIGFVGVLIALRPSPQMFSWAAPIALFGATTFALSQTITRELRGVHWLPLVFWQFVGSGLIGAATVPWAWTTPTLFDLGLMFLVGVVSMTCFIFIVRALALARAAVLAPLQYSAIVWAAILGWLDLARRPDAADHHRQRHHHRQRALRRGAGQDGRRRGRVSRSSRSSQ